MTPDEVMRHREMVKREMELSRNRVLEPDELEVLDQMITAAEAEVASVPPT